MPLAKQRVDLLNRQMNVFRGIGGKEYLVEARLLPIARQMQLGSVGDLIGRLRSAPDNGLHARVIEAMVTTLRQG